MPQLSPFAFAPVSPFAPAFAPALVSPFAPAPAPAIAADVPQARESFRTKADSIEVEVDDAAKRASLSLPEARGRESWEPPAPSTNELLERAAALGPARMTWESIVPPADPILDEKRQPHVAERRARLTRFVKMGLGGCLTLCVLALFVTALSASSGDSSTPKASAAAVGKTVASKGVVPVETLEGTKHAKAVRRVAPVVTTAAIVRPKRR